MTTSESDGNGTTIVHQDLRVAVLLPCYNEEAAVATVVEGFRKALPDAEIYVYDNASSDKTAERAREAGAIVRHEPQRGKGNVVKRMFADIEADVYLMVDGDATYDAERAPQLIAKLVTDNLAMVVGTRTPVDQGADTYRAGHQFGNAMLTGTVAHLFGQGLTDMLSGYRVMTRRFVKSFPVLSQGFEIETETTIHTLQLGLPVGEVETRYFPRPEGSESKLSTYRDGFRILFLILFLLKEVKPFLFFGTIATVLTGVAVILAVPIFGTYLETGLVPRFPTAILSTGLMIIAALSFVSGVILDSVSRGRLEQKKLHYLSQQQGPREAAQ